MDTSKKYYDFDGNMLTITQMVDTEPFWAAVRIQEGEKAIEYTRKLEIAMCCFAREELENMNFENDKEVIDYMLSFYEKEELFL